MYFTLMLKHRPTTFSGTVSLSLSFRIYLELLSLMEEIIGYRDRYSFLKCDTLRFVRVAP